jgi:hypothetical protein
MNFELITTLNEGKGRASAVHAHEGNECMHATSAMSMFVRRTLNMKSERDLKIVS